MTLPSRARGRCGWSHVGGTAVPCPRPDRWSRVTAPGARCPGRWRAAPVPGLWPDLLPRGVPGLLQLLRPLPRQRRRVWCLPPRTAAQERVLPVVLVPGRYDRDAAASDARSAVVLAPWLARVRQHQLFFAGMERRRGRRGRPRGATARKAARSSQPRQRPAGHQAAARNWHCSCPAGTTARCDSTCAAAGRRATRSWPGRCTWPISPPRPAAGSRAPGARCSASWSACWPATATVRPSPPRRCTPSPPGTAWPATMPSRSWPQWGSSLMTGPTCPPAGWTPNSPAWPPGWPARHAAGH